MAKLGLILLSLLWLAGSALACFGATYGVQQQSIVWVGAGIVGGAVALYLTWRGLMAAAKRLLFPASTS